MPSVRARDNNSLVRISITAYFDDCSGSIGLNTHQVPGEPWLLCLPCVGIPPTPEMSDSSANELTAVHLICQRVSNFSIYRFGHTAGPISPPNKDEHAPALRTDSDHETLPVKCSVSGPLLSLRICQCQGR